MLCDDSTRRFPWFFISRLKLTKKLIAGSWTLNHWVESFDTFVGNAAETFATSELWQISPNQFSVIREQFCCSRDSCDFARLHELDSDFLATVVTFGY
jgi:hypothetical protein